MMILTLLIPLIWAPSVFALTSNPILLNYEDLPAYIKRENFRVRSSSQRLEAQENRLGHLGRSYLPEFQATLGREAFKLGLNSWDNQPHWGLGARINLYRGGQDALEESIREKAVIIEKTENESTYWSELTRARETYAELIYIEALKKLNEEESKLNQKNSASAFKRIQAGVATRTDQLEFEMHAIALQQDRARISSEDLRLQAELRTALNLAADSNIQFAPDAPHIHEWQSVLPKINPETQPLLVQARAIEEQQSLSSTQASRMSLPALDLVAGWEQLTSRQELGSPADRRQASVGAQLSWSLGKAIEGRVESRSLALQSKASATELSHQSKALSESLSALWVRIGLIHDQIHEALKNVERGENYLASTLSEYSRGVKNSPDVLGATQRYIEFKRRHLELDRDFRIAKAKYAGLAAGELLSHR
jgi:outer membrane protein